MHRAQVQRGRILQVGIEEHLPSHAIIFFDIGQRVVYPRPVQPRLANRIQQQIHRVIGH